MKETASAKETKAAEIKKTSPKKATAESVYGVAELAANAEVVFGKTVRSECVVAAFKAAGKTSATKAEAQKIVNDFLKKEVK